MMPEENKDLNGVSPADGQPEPPKATEAESTAKAADTAGKVKEKKRKKGEEADNETRFPTVKPRRSSLKRQRLAVLISLGVVVVLAVAMVLVWHFTSRTLVTFPDGTAVEDSDGMRYYTVKRDGAWVMINKDGDLCPVTAGGLYKTKDQTLVSVDAETGKPTVVAAVLLNGTESSYFNAVNNTFDILLYPMLERAEIQSIEIKNSKDHITFVYDAKKQTFVIKGHEDTPYNSIMFSTLVSITGYTNTVARLDLSPENPDAEGFRQNGYAEYGLPEDPNAAENYFVITTKDGQSHKVIIGNVILDDTGYYARYAGRDEVYILQQLTESEYNSTLSATLLCTLEDYVTPTVTTTLGASNYFDVTDFTIWAADGSSTSTDLSTFTQMIQFSYEPIELRKNTFYANTSHYGQGKLEGYAIDDYRAQTCLQNIMDMLPSRTVKVYDDYTNTQANLEDFIATYGAAFAIEFTFNAERRGEEGDYEPVKDAQVHHQIWISPVHTTEDGQKVYYMYNEMFNMIVETGRQHLIFLEWADIDWVDHSIFRGDIGYMEKMEITVKDGTTAGLTGVTNVVFDVAYLNDKGEQMQGSSQGGSVVVFASYNGMQKVPLDNSDKRFNLFYQVLLASNLEDAMPSDSKAYQEELKATTPDLSITITFLVGDGKRETRTFNIYSRTANGTRSAYVTINGIGHFYMAQYRIDKIINDVGRLLSTNPADVIDPTARS